MTKERNMTMKKTKRILALVLVVLLVLLYLSTLVFALLDAPVFTSLLKASVAATILDAVFLSVFAVLSTLVFFPDILPSKALPFHSLFCSDSCKSTSLTQISALLFYSAPCQNMPVLFSLFYLTQSASNKKARNKILKSHS